jgi:hypothetical protein
MDEWEWDHEHQPCSGWSRTRTFAPCSASARRATSSTSLARGARAPGRIGVVQRREGRRRRAHRDHGGTSSRRTACAASVVCPSYFRTNLMSSLRGADEELSGVVAHPRPVLADHRGRHRRRRPRGARPRGRAHRAGPAGARRVRAQAGRPGRRTTPSCAPRPPSSTGGSDGLHQRGREPGQAGPRRGRVRRRGGRGLAARARHAPGALGRRRPGRTPEVRQFRGGASNLTYLLRYPPGT